MDDVYTFNYDLGTEIMKNAQRFVGLFMDVIDKELATLIDNSKQSDVQLEIDQPSSIIDKVPIELLRTYEFSFKAPRVYDSIKFRKIMTAIIPYYSFPDLDINTFRTYIDQISNGKTRRFIPEMFRFISWFNVTRKTDLLMCASIIKRVFPDYICDEILDEHSFRSYISIWEKTHPTHDFSSQLFDLHELALESVFDIEILSMRKLRAENVGRLVTFEGMVMNCEHPKHKADVILYICDLCAVNTYQKITSRTYLPVEFCESATCRNLGARLTSQTRGSKFVNYQEIVIQERPGEVPVGRTPITRILRCIGQKTRLLKAGDDARITGILLIESPKPTFTRDVNPTYFLDVHQIEVLGQSGENLEEDGITFTNYEHQLLARADVFAEMAASIAPEIHGLLDIKKAILLQMIGSISKYDGECPLRGTIHVCIIGDPGMAKSQLLRVVTRFVSRSQYVCGANTSEVGLTASLVINPITKEMVVDLGVLPLADGSMNFLELWTQSFFNAFRYLLY
jgi:DNA replicative helicase MCM subunit Mcm2 (Cdc46/Mcm family)